MIFSHVFFSASLGRHIHRAVSTHSVFRLPSSPQALNNLFDSPWSPHFFFSRPWSPQPSAQFEVWVWPPFSYSAERGMGNLGRIVCVLDRVSPKPLRNFYKCFVWLLLVATAVAQFRHLFFFAAPLPRSSPPLSSFNRCFPGAISAATCCAIPTHGFLAPLSRHIHCVVATHLSTSSPLGRHIRCAISTSVFLSPPFVAASAK